MNRDEFFEKLPGYVEAEMLEMGITDVSLEETTVTKHNDTVLHGILFKREGSFVAPTFYMEEFYDAFDGKADPEIAARQMVRSYLVTGRPWVPEGSIEIDLEQREDELGFRILDIEKNRDYLDGVPYRRMCGDLVMIADLTLGGTGEWRTVVCNELLEDCNYPEEKLFDRAMENTVKNDPPVLTEISDDIHGKSENLIEMDKENFPRDKVYVLSNTSRRLGAGVIFYPGVAGKVADLAGGYTVVPSSIHETILIPDSLQIPVPVMQYMLDDANSNVVDAKEVLSDRLFHVDETGKMVPMIRAEYKAEQMSGVQ